MRKQLTLEAYQALPWYKKPFYGILRHFSTVEDAYSARPKKWIYNIIFIVVLLGTLLWCCLDLGTFESFRNPNWAKLGKMLSAFLHPDFDYMFGMNPNSLFKFTDSVLYQIIETFAIAFIGTTIASLLSIPFGFLASRAIVGKWSIVSEVLLIVIRTVPEILLGLVLIQVFGFGPFTGVAVLSIHSIGMIGKMYAEQLDMISPEPLEALDAVGATPIARLRLGVVPQVAPNFLNVILYRFDLNIRTASLLGLVGAGGVGYPISIYSQGERWPQLASVLYGVIFLVIAIDLVSGAIRKKLL